MPTVVVTMKIVKYPNKYNDTTKEHKTHIWFFASWYSISFCFVIYGYGFKVRGYLPKWRISRWLALNVWLRNKWTYRLLKPLFEAK